MSGAGKNDGAPAGPAAVATGNSGSMLSRLYRLVRSWIDAPEPPATGKPSASKLLLSYRFLRSGIVAVVVLLSASIAYEIVDRNGCWRGSISAYFYSPVQTVFVGGLLAIGLSLIVLQGERGAEEVCLNLAGMLAPVVAFVPTKVSTACPGPGPFNTATEAQRTALGESLASDTTLRMQNNMVVYLGVVGLVLLLLFIWPHGFVRDTGRVWILRVMVVVYAGVAGLFTYWLWNNWDGKDSSAHNIAAYTMFGFFGVVVLINGAFRRRTTGAYKVAYLTILGLMIVLGGIVWLTFPEDHRVFFLEAVEIALFGTFWLLQTVQFRNEEPTADVPPAKTSVLKS